MKGFFPIYKEKGMTSHDVVNCLRKITGIRKIGHAGTLDPLAEGVLVVAVGSENTKKINIFVSKEKEYIGTINLGSKSLTGDLEGPIYEVSNKKPTKKEVIEKINLFKGRISQKPHKYSAVKINGKKAYSLARKNKSFETKSRIVEIKEIELIEYNYPLIIFRTVVGPGTYIRSLAEDIGEKLETGAYLKNLERTRVGCFTKKESLTINEFKEKLKK